MNHSCHSIGTVFRTATRPVAVPLAFLVLVSVAGAEPAFAALENTATVTGEYNGLPVPTASDSLSVPVSASGPALEVTKVGTPDTNVPAGTVVTYTYTVRNSGNQTISNISLSDVHAGAGAPPVPGNETLTSDVGTPNDSTDATPNDGVWSTLAPGDVITLTATYTIIQTDVDQSQ
jgi:large repetitive protein